MASGSISRYDPNAKTLSGYQITVTPNEIVRSGDIAVDFTDPDKLTCKGRNLQLPDPVADLDITFARVEATAETRHEK